MMRLAWCRYIYFVWQERNGRIHSSDLSAVSILVKQAIQSMWFQDPERCCWKPKFDRFLEQMGFAPIHSDRVLMELQFNHTVFILELKPAWQAKLPVVTCTRKKNQKKLKLQYHPDSHQVNNRRFLAPSSIPDWFRTSLSTA